MKRIGQVSSIEKIYVILLLVIFGGIVLHAPLTIFLGTLAPEFSLYIKAWKEVLMGAAGLLLIYVLHKNKRFTLLKDPLLIGVGAYIILHVLLVFFSGNNITSLTAGLLIDLRYVVFFALVYIAIKLYPEKQRSFIKVGIAGALVVTGFAILQVFVLPIDILKYIGYSTQTIVPYLTVDQNMDYIRINSTLRGPNPLGAYAVIVLSCLIAFWLRAKHGAVKRPLLYAGIILIGGIIALWASYSRSALLAAIISFGLIIGILFLRRFSKKIWFAIAIVGLMSIGGLYLARDTSFVNNVILHEDPTEGNDVNSNQGHIDSLQDGTNRMFMQPFGGGIGSTGSASFSTDAPLIIENQYLFIAHEVGWLGLGLFIMIFIGVLTRLWQRRAHWLALSVFASGIGMAVIGLLLPVWVDDTVSIIWWGLAAIAIGGRYRG